MSMSRLTRRSFLGAAALAGAATIVPRHVLGGAGFVPPSAKLNIAGVGIAAMGSGNLRALESQNIVALCDVDFDYAAPTFKRYPAAVTYKDYRVMLDRQKDIEAVLIATPDHTHAIISMAAMRAGKHVYCQKPLTHDVHEARALTLAARGTRLATQTGNQGMSSDEHRSI